MSSKNIIMAAAGVSTKVAGAWIATLDTASNIDKVSGMAIDTGGNTYITGQANYSTTTASYTYVAKLNSSGDVVWKKSIDTASQPDSGNAIAVDGSGNVYITGIADVYGGINSYGFVVKYDTNGTITWQRKLDTVATADSGGYGIAVDSNSNVYVTGQFIGVPNAAGAIAALVKYNASGDLQWQKGIRLTTASFGYGITTDSTGNIYIVTTMAAGTAGYMATIKCNSAGEILWQKQLNNATNYTAGYAIALDSNNNVYTTGYSVASGGNCLIAKYDNSGNLLWQYSYDTLSTNIDSGLCITVDNTGAGSLYVGGEGGYTVATPTTAFSFIIKFDLDCNILWQRKFDKASATDFCKGIALDSLGFMYIAGYHSAVASSIYVARLPSDGTIPGTGTYTVAGSTALTYSATTVASPLSQFTHTDAVSTLVMSDLDPNAWFSKSVSSAAAQGRAVAIDASGNVYTTGYGAGAANTATANYEYGVVTKYDKDGVDLWTRTMDATNNGDYAYGIAVDTAGNVYITGYANNQIAGSYPTFVFIMKYNTSGDFQWRRNLDSVGVVDSPTNIAVDSTGNIYITGQANTNTLASAFVVKYNTNGVIQWQRFIDSSSSTSDSGYGIAVDSDSNVYVTGSANASTYQYSFIVKYNTSGVLLLQVSLDTAGTNDAVYGIALDASRNIYITGTSNTGASSNGLLVKFNSSLEIQWQRTFPSSSSTLTPIAVNNAGDIIIGYGNSYINLMKYNTNGVLQWQYRLAVGGGFTGKCTGLAIDKTGDYYYQSGYAGSSPSWAYCAKLPISGKTLIGITSGLTFLTTSVVDSAAALNSVTMTNDYWVATLDTDTVEDYAKGVAVDGSGNVYITGKANTTTASYAFVAKYNNTGTIIWQRKLDSVTTVSDLGNAIAVDSSGNVYVTGQENTGTAGSVFIVKFDTSGNSVWKKKLHTSTPVEDIGNGIAVDGSGNVYVTGRGAAGSTNSYIFIAKYDTAGAYQWQRKLDTASNHDIGNGIAVDSVGNSYVIGQANATTAANSFVVIAKYNAAGIYQWQQKLDTSTPTALADSGYGIAVDSNSNVYVTGQAAGPSYTFVAKYDTDGVWQWQRQLDTSAITDAGYGIAVDSQANVYITGSGGAVASTTTYVIIVKYDTNGVIKWQRKLDGGSTTTSDVGYGIAVDSSGNYYVAGQLNYTTASSIFVAKLPTSGAIHPGGYILAYSSAESTLIDSVGTLPHDICALSTGDATMTPGDSALTDSVSSMTSKTYSFALIDSAGTMVDSVDSNCWIARTATSNIHNPVVDVKGVSVDSSGNVYMVGQTHLATNPATGGYGGIIKYNISGTSQFIKGLTCASPAGSGLYFITSVIDSSGNIFVGGYDNAATPYGFVAKYDSTGTFVWYTKVTTAYNTRVLNGMQLDSSGNIYTLTSEYLVKLNADGTIGWVYNLVGVLAASYFFTSIGSTGEALNIDSDGNIYITGCVLVSAVYKCVLIKLNSAGTAVWKKQIDTSGFAGVSVKFDSSKNPHIIASAGSGLAHCIIKFDTNGSIVWQSSITTISINSMAVDNNGDVYILGRSGTAAADADLLIAKFDNTGKLVWQQLTGVTGTIDTIGCIALNGDNIIIGLTVQNRPCMILSTPKSGIILKYGSGGADPVVSVATKVVGTPSHTVSDVTITFTAVTLTKNTSNALSAVATPSLSTTTTALSAIANSVTNPPTGTYTITKSPQGMAESAASLDQGNASLSTSVITL